MVRRVFWIGTSDPITLDFTLELEGYIIVMMNIVVMRKINIYDIIDGPKSNYDPVCNTISSKRNNVSRTNYLSFPYIEHNLNKSFSITVYHKKFKYFKFYVTVLEYKEKNI